MDIFSDDFLLPERVPEAEASTGVQYQLPADLEDILKPDIAPLNSYSKMNGFNSINETLPETIPSAEVNLLLDAELPTSSTRKGNQETEKLKIWEEEQKKRLAEKDAEEERRKQDMLKTAKKELEDWYKAHDEQVAKTKAANRNAEKIIEEGSSIVKTGNEWTRVAEMCDFGPRRGRDVTRMRSLLLQLKQSGARPKYPPRNNDS